jgi:3-phosphoshikimate 1-carboxyvinyltransferase
MKLRKKAYLPQFSAITLPGSKSISHRVLIAADLCDMPKEKIEGISDCDDTQYLQRALQNQQQTRHHFGDGATPLHFFMAMAAAKTRVCILTGSANLMQRPHRDLIDLLGQCGTIIKQSPEEIIIEKGIQSFRSISADATRSSQHISAMMLVAPCFPGRKEIQLKGKPASFPYIRLTAEMLRLFGVETAISQEKIIINEGSYKAPNTINIEPDWSSAAFFYSLVACEPQISILLKGLSLQSLQGDFAIAGFYHELGVTSLQTETGVLISHNGLINTKPFFDLRHHPDCAPALLAASAYLHLNAEFAGLENLAIKESNRIQAMIDNLQQAGISLVYKNGLYRLVFDNLSVENVGHYHIHTHNDHRIAMAMAVFGLKYDITIDNSDCVNKSFPGFWQQWSHWFQAEP